VDGVEELLNHVHASGYSSSIVTNGMKEVQRPRIKKCNWEHYFKNIFVSDEMGVAKPQIAFFDHCMEVSGQPDKADILVIGDTLESDILGANRAGLKSCWMNPDNKVHPSDIVPDYQISKLSDLLDII